MSQQTTPRVMPGKAAATKSRRRTTAAEYLMMVEFIEIDTNVQLITGGAAKGKPMQAGQKLTKADAYRALAEYMNKKLKDPKRIWTASEAKSRWESYWNRYKATHKQIHSQTGFGLTQKDEDQGILTMAEKEERMCPYYCRLDALFGQRQNINPAVIFEVATSPQVALDDDGAHSAIICNDK
uniref:Myb/SANT-like domain-containing protein n=1 Tax=Spongospora subterranea TaxID=70186 RepID=A0A0H5R3L9_9EUKA|eukprot:CRZ08496.1 hypothetical protein [Spongospora subterranea]